MEPIVPLDARERCRGMKTSWSVGICLALATVAALAPAEEGGDSEAELAKKLQNPVANLISVPIQNNWDFGIGPSNAMRYLVNVQPVIPFSLTKEWIGRLPISLGLGARYYAEAPSGGPDWGLRFVVTLLLPS